MVNLLSEYATAEKLFTAELEGKKDAEPLAVLYTRALQQDREQRIRTLKQLGDQSLYTAGFFRQSLEDRVVGADYYMQMGRKAYAAIADLSPSSTFTSVPRVSAATRAAVSASVRDRSDERLAEADFADGGMRRDPAAGARSLAEPRAACRSRRGHAARGGQKVA